MPTPTRNVIVFTSDDNAFAIELRWVHEIFTLGHVTPVPHAPPAVAGVVNFHGSIVSVIDIRGLAPRQVPVQATQGESALLIEVNRLQAALCIGSIDEIASLPESDSPACVVDSQHRNVAILLPQDIFSRVMQTPIDVMGRGAS